VLRWLWPFARSRPVETERPVEPETSSAPTVSDCGRELAHFRALNDRERVKARARLMREERGLPPLDVLK